MPSSSVALCSAFCRSFSRPYPIFWIDSTDPSLSAPAGPLYVGHALLYPNLGEPIRKSGAGDLSFYFALYGDVGAASASAQLLRNGQVLAAAPVPLPAATGSRGQHVGRPPIGPLPTRTYQLRIPGTCPGP